MAIERTLECRVPIIFEGETAYLVMPVGRGTSQRGNLMRKLLRVTKTLICQFDPGLMYADSICEQGNATMVQVASGITLRIVTILTP